MTQLPKPSRNMGVCMSPKGLYTFTGNIKGAGSIKGTMA